MEPKYSSQNSTSAIANQVHLSSIANQVNLSSPSTAVIFKYCHPERSEGPWFLPQASPLPANTRIPRCARDDRVFSFTSSLKLLQPRLIRRELLRNRIAD